MMHKLQHTHHSNRSELLSTKLTPPHVSGRLVTREALLDRLDAGLDRKLTLLSAPAGFGKTTLVASWLKSVALRPIRPIRRSQGRQAQEPRRTQSAEQEMASVAEAADGQLLYALRSTALRSAVAWVSLEPADNDPVRFWRYVITACQAFAPAVGAAALDLLDAAQQPPLEAALTPFINDLAQLSHHCILVLEDYHVLRAWPIHETLAMLLDHLPATLHLMIVTRSDPPLPLARLRASNELNELRAADLRFSAAETQRFLQQALPFSLAPEAVARLGARTEGWVAGLRMVALALQGRPEQHEIEQFLDTFAGSHRHIVEYLAADVLGAQPEPLQVFLLQTSILSRLTGSLCDAVTGRTDSASILEQIERANLFLTPLDSAQQWYRYHALFAEAMRHEARRHLGAAGLHTLYSNASRWYEQHGQLAEAVETAIAAQAFPRAAELIGRLTELHGFNNEVQTLRRWIEQLPKEVLRVHPALCLSYALAILFTEERHAPATLALLQTPLQMAEQRWQAEGDRPKLGAVLAFRAMTAWWQGDLTLAFSNARQALELLPARETQWRGIALMFVAAEELLAGKLNAARQTVQAARALCEAAGNSYGISTTTGMLGELCDRQGELQQAAQIYRQMLLEVSEALFDRRQAIYERGRALIGLAGLAYEWNDLVAAERSASQAVEIGSHLSAADLLAQGSLVLARILYARGQASQAQALLQPLVAQVRQPLLFRALRACQARLALAEGDTTTVQRWYATCAEPGAETSLAQQEQEALIGARLLIAQGEAEVALRLLDRWQADARAQGRVRSTLEITILIALAHAAAANLAQARQTLMEALELAQRKGYQRLFLDEGPALAELLQIVVPDVREEQLAAYVRNLLLASALERSVPAGSPPPAVAPLIEPLSPQEQRVLRLLAAGLSNPEIAQELVVSVNTIKTQVKSIYRKLNVASRSEVRAAARYLHLR